MDADWSSVILPFAGRLGSRSRPVHSEAQVTHWISRISLAG